MIGHVGDIEQSVRRIERDIVRLHQSATLRRTLVQQRRNDTGAAIDPPHALVQPIRDKNSARTIDGYAIRLIELRTRGRPIIAGETALASAAIVLMMPVPTSIRRRQ